MESKKRANTKAKNRKKRKPLSQNRILDAEHREGFEPRFVNEEPGRVEMFLDAGWKVVSGQDRVNIDSRAQDASQLGSVVRRVVNRDPSARAQTAVLMEIEKEFYDEDQLYKHQKINEKEKTFDPGKYSADHQYGSFKISR